MVGYYFFLFSEDFKWRIKTLSTEDAKKFCESSSAAYKRVPVKKNRIFARNEFEYLMSPLIDLFTDCSFSHALYRVQFWQFGLFS